MLTTLCYIEKNNKYLMIYRNKKKNDINKGKWIGVGGHFEAGESPEECLLREVKEETGLTLTDYNLRGIITFVFNDSEIEYMFLYTATGFTGELIECNEGELKWINKSDINSLSLWEGDKIFLDLISRDTPMFSLKLKYNNDSLIEAKLDNNILL